MFTVIVNDAFSGFACFIGGGKSCDQGISGIFDKFFFDGSADFGGSLFGPAHDTDPDIFTLTGLHEDVKVGVMGYPERATAERGAQIEREFVENASAALKEAIAQADRARKSGERINHADNDKMKIFSI